MTATVSVVVFSDADGVLHKPSTDALARARRSLARIDEARINLVLCSLKTRAELELLHQELGLRQPFIAEGGAAAFIPSGYFESPIAEARERSGYDVLEFGPPYADVVQTLRATAARLGVSVHGFSDMTVESVAEACDLPLLRARLATLREYVEPFTVVDGGPTGRARLLRALASQGLQTCSRAGYDYLGGTAEYTPAVRALHRHYASFGRILTVGLVDVLGTCAFLPDMDYQVIVHDDEQHAGAVDVGEWAEGLVQTAVDVRERQAAAGQRRRPAALHINH